VKIGTETPIFLFWEYLFRNFGIVFAVWEINGKLREHKKTFVETGPQDVTSFLHLLVAPKILHTVVSDIFPQYGTS
jgi:hypothetical protein